MSSTLLDSYRKQSSVDAKAILNSGISTLDAISSILAAMPFTGTNALSVAESSFVATFLGGGGDLETSNKVVDATYILVRDYLAMAAEHTRVLERFIGLHVPQMGDGNNFGVTVQMMYAKLLKEEREKMEKSLTETSKYYSSRADAMDKFTHIPKVSTTETKSSQQTSATGGKDGDESKTSTSSSTEEKIATTDNGKVNLHRVKALAALDAQMYMDLMTSLQSMRNGYMVILDNLEKNWEKLENPRGKGYDGYGSGGRSMVY